MQRAAIYVRVSTDSDAQKDSPANQIATCKEYAEQIGLATSDALIYNDAGISGTEMTNRPEVGRMLADARASKFDAVLFTAISRFSRDLSDAFSTKKRLEVIYGIRLISIEEGYDSAVEGRNSEMVFTVHAMLAAHKSQEMSKAIRRGLRQSARRGHHIGNVPPYGYMKDPNKRLRPDPQSAPIVRDIFAMYLSGMSARSIAENLNGRCVPTASSIRSRPASWRASTITAMLHNEAYSGTLVAHRRTQQQDVESSRRANTEIKRLRLRDESDWIVVPQAHEAIVDSDTFVRVQQLMDMKARNKGVRREPNLLAGLLKCACCGGSMTIASSGTRKTGSPYKYVVCSKVKRIGKLACNNHTRIDYAALLSALLTPLRTLSPSSDTVKRVSEHMERSRSNDNLTIAERLTSLCGALAANQDAQAKNLLAYRSDLFPAHLIERSQRELSAQETALQQEIEHLERLRLENQDRLESAAFVDIVTRMFDHLSEFDPVTIRLALQSIVKRIMIDEHGHVSVYFTWSPG